MNQRYFNNLDEYNLVYESALNTNGCKGLIEAICCLVTEED